MVLEKYPEIASNVPVFSNISPHIMQKELFSPYSEKRFKYVFDAGTEMILPPGMVFTIEPMVNMGKHDIVQDSENGWTIYTEDGKPSAQWEIQVLVTETGAEILSW